MTAICKSCGVNPAPKAKYYGLCSFCRSKKYDFSKNKKCPDCGKLVNNKATRCIPCAIKLRRIDRSSVCIICNTPFVFRKDRSPKYCSVECRKTVTSRPYRRKYTDTITPLGYVENWGDNRDRRTFVHIIKAEKALGRRLKKGEVVHHINLDKSDNRNCNLLVCTQSYHLWLHHQMQYAWVREHPELKEPH